jgi:aldose 1-epimerase
MRAGQDFSPGSPQGQPWGTLPDGRQVHRFSLHSASGVQVDLAEYGARLIRVQTPDRSGRLGDVMLGHEHLGPYLDRATAPYFGATVGRYANRIARGRFGLDGHEYQLAANNPPNHLHGGPGGFDAVLWAGQGFAGEGHQEVLFSRVSPEGEEGYPGAVDLRVRYTLSDSGTLAFEVQGRTTRPTLLNVTNHAYWNLASGGAQSVLDQRLTLAAQGYLPIDDTQIPLGHEEAVAGTPFDFLKPRAIGDAIGADDLQLRRAGGYDHHFVLPGPAPVPGNEQATDLRWAATLSDPGSGRQLQLWTTEPGLQVYSGNFLDGTVVGRDGARYQQRASVCLEAQHAPDSPNRPEFPSVVLRPGVMYSTRTEWRFSAGE